jgi:hypothetical protein
VGRCRESHHKKRGVYEGRTRGIVPPYRISSLILYPLSLVYNTASGGAGKRTPYNAG